MFSRKLLSIFELNELAYQNILKYSWFLWFPLIFNTFVNSRWYMLLLFFCRWYLYYTRNWFVCVENMQFVQILLHLWYNNKRNESPLFLFYMKLKSNFVHCIYLVSELSPKRSEKGGSAALTPLSWRAGDSPERGNVAAVTKGWGSTEAQQYRKPVSY